MDIAAISAAVNGSATAINEAVALLGRIRGLVTEQSELKAVVAELAEQLAESKLKTADLKSLFADLRAELTREKPTEKQGCYVFDGDENLYCPYCFTTDGRKCATLPPFGGRNCPDDCRLCPSCKTEVRTGEDSGGA